MHGDMDAPEDFFPGGETIGGQLTGDPSPSPFDRFRLRSGLSNCEKGEEGNDRGNL
jgi:hypothetical protein